jgi:hypothetical protein
VHHNLIWPRALALVAAATALMTAAVAQAPAAPAELQISPVGPDLTLGCVTRPGMMSTRLTAKARLGRNTSPGFRPTLNRLAQRRAQLKRSSSPAARSKLRALEQTIAGVRGCRDGKVKTPSRKARSFHFFCLQAFSLPSAISRDYCGVNLEIVRASATGAPTRPEVVGFIDDLLATECEDDGGKLFVAAERHINDELYWSHCRLVGGSTGDYGDIVNAMEVENADCFGAFRAFAAKKDSDPCAPPPPSDNHPRPSPSPSPSPDPPPCVILRMDVENADC